VKAVLLDVDGVLFDSAEAIYQTFKTVLRERGLKCPSRGKTMKHFGLQVPPWLKEMGICSGTGIAREIEERFVDEFLPKHSAPERGLVETLNALRAKKIAVGVVTSQTKYQAEKSLKLVGFEFDCVVTGDDGKPKPAPDLLLNALKKLGVKKKDAVYVGDTWVDVEAGRAAGVKTLILARPYNKGLPNRTRSLKRLIARRHTSNKIVIL